MTIYEASVVGSGVLIIVVLGYAALAGMWQAVTKILAKTPEH